MPTPPDGSMPSAAHPNPTALRSTGIFRCWMPQSTSCVGNTSNREFLAAFLGLSMGGRGSRRAASLEMPGLARASPSQDTIGFFMSKARYVMIGGFLGAGKTTAILKLAEHLTHNGLRVGLITNDQSFGLVDTAMLNSHGFP